MSQCYVDDLKVDWSADRNPRVTISVGGLVSLDPELNQMYREEVSKAQEHGWAVLKSVAEKTQSTEAVVNWRNVRRALVDAQKKVEQVGSQLRRAKDAYWASLQKGKDDPKTSQQVDELETEKDRAIRRCRDLVEVLDRLRPAYEDSIRSAVEAARAMILKKADEDKKTAQQELAQTVLRLALPIAVADGIGVQFGLCWGDDSLRYIESIPDPIPSV